MNKAASTRRSIRHSLESELIAGLHRTAVGKRATVAQVKAAVRQILMRATARKEVAA